MCRLVRAFAGRIYHILGNLMSQLIYWKFTGYTIKKYFISFRRTILSVQNLMKCCYMRHLIRVFIACKTTRLWSLRCKYVFWNVYYTSVLRTCISSLYNLLTMFTLSDLDITVINKPRKFWFPPLKKGHVLFLSSMASKSESTLTPCILRRKSLVSIYVFS